MRRPERTEDGLLKLLLQQHLCFVLQTMPCGDIGLLLSSGCGTMAIAARGDQQNDKAGGGGAEKLHSKAKRFNKCDGGGERGEREKDKKTKCVFGVGQPHNDKK